MFESLNHKIHQYMRVIVLNSKICNGFHSSNSLTQSYTHHFPYLYKHLCSSFSLLINISLILYTPHSLSFSLWMHKHLCSLLILLIHFSHYICYLHTPLYCPYLHSIHTSKFIIFAVKFLNSIQSLLQVDVGHWHLTYALGQAHLVTAMCAWWHCWYCTIRYLTVLCDIHIGRVGSIHLASLLQSHCTVLRILSRNQSINTCYSIKQSVSNISLSLAWLKLQVLYFRYHGKH